MSAAASSSLSSMLTLGSPLVFAGPLGIDSNMSVAVSGSLSSMPTPIKPLAKGPPKPHPMFKIFPCPPLVHGSTSEVIDISNSSSTIAVPRLSHPSMFKIVIISDSNSGSSGDELPSIGSILAEYSAQQTRKQKASPSLLFDKRPEPTGQGVSTYYFLIRI